MKAAKQMKIDMLTHRHLEVLGLASLGVAAIGCIGASWIGPKEVKGLALGAGMMAFFLTINILLSRWWLRALTKHNTAYVGLLFSKWVLAFLALYGGIVRGWAAPEWICLGAGILPATVTLFAVGALVKGKWQ